MKLFTHILTIASLGLFVACSSHKDGEMTKNSSSKDATKGATASLNASPIIKDVKKDAEGELKWYNWNEGYQMSLKSKKVVMVDLYTSWCGWCKRMDHDTYTNPDIIKYINSKFIPIKLNPEAAGTYKVDSMSMSGAQLMGMLTNNQSTGYPTIVFIYPNRNIELYPGYQDAKGFQSTLSAVVEKANAKPGK